jgi:hypothetical protein
MNASISANRVSPPSHTLPTAIDYRMQVLDQMTRLNLHNKKQLDAVLFVIKTWLGSCLSTSGDGLREVNDETKENKRLYSA